MTLTRGRIPIYQDEAGAYKVCADCGARFPVEYMRTGQISMRKLCADCRVVHSTRRAGPLQGVPANAPRCADCGALVGLDWGTVTHLDANDRCPDCARWAAKTYARELREAEGLVMRGGLWVNPADDPAYQWRSERVGSPIKTATTPRASRPPEPPESSLAASQGHTGNDALDKALAAVGEVYGFTPEELLQPDRLPERTAARWGIWRALVAAGWTQRRVGAAFGVHHSALARALESQSPAVREAEALARRYVRPDPPVEPAPAQPGVPRDDISELAITAAWWAADRLAQYAGYDGVAAARGRGRANDLARLRHAIAQELAEAGWTYTLIGGLLDRHHTSIMNGVSRRHAEITHYRGVYAGLLAQGVLAPDPQVVARVRGRAAELNAIMLRSARPAGTRSYLPGPPGYVPPSVLARRWGVPAQTVRYHIHMGRLPGVVRGEDGRWWLDPETDLAAVVAS